MTATRTTRAGVAAALTPREAPGTPGRPAMVESAPAQTSPYDLRHMSIPTLARIDVPPPVDRLARHPDRLSRLLGELRSGHLTGQ